MCVTSLSGYLDSWALIILMKGVVNILVDYSWPDLSQFALQHPLPSNSAQQDISILHLEPRLDSEAAHSIWMMNYSHVISLENYWNLQLFDKSIHGSCICIHDMLQAVCLLITTVVSDIWLKRHFKHRWLQNLYVTMAPSWHSLGGLEVFRCERSSLLKCHFRDICFQ